MTDAGNGGRDELERDDTAEAAPEEVAGSMRELIVELALTESAIRTSAEAGEPVEALAEQEGALLEELRQHGVGFKPLVGEDGTPAA